MESESFAFKQFEIKQEKAAMKVGTDGVLLGAWADVTGAKAILDVGAGTGLVALMLAQRSEAIVDAVEIEPVAFCEANQNVVASPWAARVTVFHSSFQEFTEGMPDQYDLIVSNPPYFANSLASPDKNRTVARHDQYLSYSELIEGATKKLSPEGRFCVIIPFAAYDEFRETARLNGFYLVKVVNVVPRESKPANRVLLEFSKKPDDRQVSELRLRDVDGNYSEAYRMLTKDYYLKL
ncbi:tRNA1(Val) (adenine(37)-N6)-methyltransferase [Prolixibacter sp. SD074]|jgi:tRNA1Val (adenine37-N6)-methyltransferase|nr:tRNA1(Val) (adenine(37)-N6)-methyltransferase [Prolixibacter sp. SD074]